RMWVYVAEERLLPVVDHRDRLAGVQREHAAVYVHGQVLAATECTADAGQCEPDLPWAKSQGGADLTLVDVQPLGGDIQVDPTVVIGHGKPGLRAQKRLVLHADLVLSGHNDVGGRVRVALSDLEV